MPCLRLVAKDASPRGSDHADSVLSSAAVPYLLDGARFLLDPDALCLSLTLNWLPGVHKYDEYF